MMFNTTIHVQKKADGADDASGNKTYSYSNMLTSELARKYEITRKKLTDDGAWLTKKFTNFDIFDLNTDLTDAVNVVCDSKNYKIESIIKPDGFDRNKYRTIETTMSESDN